MIKKIDIAGIQLDDYTVRESIAQVEKKMDDQSLYMMEEVTMDMILMAKEDERIKSAIDMLNQTIISENVILNAVEKSTLQRKLEIENHEFYKELLKRVQRNAKTIFILGKTDKEVDQMNSRIEEEFPKIKIVGALAMENCIGSVDAVLNEINAVNPDMVISIIPSPEQEIFLLENKDKLCANFWYGIGNIKFNESKKGLTGAIQKFLKLHKLERTITNYEEMEEKLEEKVQEKTDNQEVNGNEQ